MVIAVVLLLGFVTAELREEQVDQVIEKISEVCPKNINFDTPQFRQQITDTFRSQSIETGAFLPPASFTLTGCDDHKLRFFSERIFLDGEDISTLSKKVEIDQEIVDSTINGDIVQTANTGDDVSQIGKCDDSKVEQNVESKNWYVGIITDINFYVGIGLTVTLSLIWKWIRKARKRS